MGKTGNHGGAYKVKRLYKGIFQFNREIFRLHTKAHSKEQAKVYMFKRIAKEHDVSFYTVNNYFNEHDTFNVSEEN